MIGKELRLNRIFNKSGNTVLVPMDHGVTMGMIAGLENVKKTLNDILTGCVDSVVLHRGMIKNYYKQLKKANVGVLMHLSASTDVGSLSERKILTGSVYDAVMMGCDGVSIHINVGSKYESEMLKDFADISSQCDKYGMPLLAMLYARGDNVVSNDVENIKHTARIGLELGADMIKIPYINDQEQFREITDNIPLPILIAGGEKQDKQSALRMITSAIEAGARGVSVGRNVFQSEDRENLLKEISSIVHRR